MVRDAAGMSFGQWLAPSCLLRGHFKYALRAWMFFEESESEFERVFSCCMGKFVHEALDGKGIMRAPHGPPETHRHRRVKPHIFHCDVRDLIYHIFQSFHGRVVN